MYRSLSFRPSVMSFRRFSLPTKERLAIGTSSPRSTASRRNAAHAAYAPMQMIASGWARFRISICLRRLPVNIWPRRYVASPAILSPCFFKARRTPAQPLRPVRIGLVEDGDAPPADAHEVVDEAGRLLAVGGAQVEREFPVGRLALGLGAGERKEQVDLLLLELLEHRQHPGHGGRADVAEQGEHIVPEHQGHGVLDGRVGLVAVVVGPEGDSAAPDATLAIDLGEVRGGTPVELDPEPSRRTGERGGHAENDLLVGQPVRSRRSRCPHGLAGAGCDRRAREARPRCEQASGGEGTQYRSPRRAHAGPPVIADSVAVERKAMRRALDEPR